MMIRLALLMAVALGCGESDLPPEDCDPPLPSTNDEGDAWPTYTDANATLTDCSEDGLTRRRGTCSDGKAFIERSGTFTGDTQYFAGEELVGLLRYTDVVFSCDAYRFGDTECEQVSLEEVGCP